VEVIASFAASEPLATTDPVVRLTRDGAPDILMVLREEDTDREAGRYTYAHSPSGQEAEAPYVVVASLEDLSGNESSEVAIGGTTFDFSPPVIVDLEAPPTHIGPGTTVTSSFGLNEPAGAVPEVIGTDNAGLTLPFTVSDESGGYVASLVPETGDEGGPYELVVRATDEAGNERLEVVGVFNLDFTAPVLTAELPAVSLRYGEAMSFLLHSSEPLAAPPTLSTSAGEVELVSSSTLEFGYRLTALNEDVEGEHTLSLDSAMDLAGNSRTSVSLGEVSIDATPPAISDITTDATVYSAQPGHDVVTLAFAADDTLATLVVELDDGRPFECNESATQAWTCTLTISDTDAEGQRFIRILAADDAGNEETAPHPIVVDLTAPDLVPGASSSSLSPAPDAHVPSVERLTEGASAALSFLTDEPVVTPLSVSSPDAPLLTFSDVGGGSNVAFSYRVDVPVGSYVDGPAGVQVELVDEVGNARSVTIETLTLDTTDPATAAVDTPDLIVVRRLPWGAAESGGDARLSIAGGQGAVEAHATVVWWSDVDATAELARTTAAADGAFASMELPTVDLISTWLEVVDAAGNSSGLVRVRDGEWVATLNGKTAGLAFPNPHAALSRLASIDAAWVDRRGIPSVATSEHGGASVALPDGDALVSTGGLRARSLSAAQGLEGPVGRLYHQQAYDKERGRLVLFGGDCETCADTWEWDGTRWERRETTHSPPRIQAGTAGYDPVRGLTVVYGGVIDGFQPGVFPIATGQTWVFDGTDWSRILNASPPEMSVRAFGQGTYVGFDLRLKETGEVVHGGVIVYGGTEFSQPLDDMWLFMGDRWAEVDQGVEPGPEGRAGSALAWDEARDELLLHGGLSAQEGAKTGTYTFDGVEWTLVDAAGPSLRTVSATYDAERGVVVLLGNEPPNGYTSLKPTNPPPDNGPCEDANVEAWEWDGSSWSARPLGPPPVFWTSHPDRCASLQMAYDVARHETISVGWLTENNFWQFPEEHLRTWTYRLEPGAFRVIHPVVSPERRHGMSMVQHANQSVVLLGGVDDEDASTPQVYDDAWYFAGGAWQMMWWVTPSARAQAAAATFSADLGEVVRIAGDDGTNPTNDSGVYNGGNWSTLTPGTPLTVHSRSAAAYDFGRDVVVLFGGVDGNGDFLDETWEYAAGDWSLVIPASAAPSPRSEHAMVWDAVRGEVVLFGGRTNANNHDVADDETWTWDGTDWTLHSPSTSPTPRARHALVFHEQREQVLLVGGDSSESVLNPIWSWDGAEWRPVDVEGLPNNIADHGAAYEMDRATVVIFGGDTPVGGTDLTWQLENEGLPGHSFVTEVAASGIDEDWVTDLSLRAVAGGDGDVAGVPTAGAALEVWEAGRWLRVAENDAGATDLDNLGELSWSRGGARPFELVELHGRVLARVLPLGSNAVTEAQVASDYFELTLSYRLD
jgi:hypothetical protein